MLYEQIRYADVIRGVYRMRHMLTQKKRPDLGTRLGYPKYSKQFYRITSKLKAEGIIGSHGMFTESPPNLHLVAMPLRVDRVQISVLGRRVPYVLFLSLATGPPRKAGYLASGCPISRKAVYDALKKMEGAGLVRMDGSTAAAEEGSARAWLAGYIEAARSWIDASGDASVLFNTIPSYVGGPHARHLLHYEPGRPMGLAEMHIFTYGPLLDLMEAIVRESRYFQGHSGSVSVHLAGDGQVRRVDGVPYQIGAHVAGG